MKASYVVFARNKRKHLEACLQSAVAQSWSDLEIVFSDQGSTDGTRELMQEYADRYKGPAKIRVLDCPDRTPPGMSALNEHLNWIMTQLDTDVVLVSASDDVAHPNRTAKVMQAYEQHDPAMVLTAMQFDDVDNPAGRSIGNTAYERPEGFLTGAEIIENHIGGSASQSWRLDFFNKIGGCKGIQPQDVFYCFLAAQDKGVYWLPEQLYCYVMHADEHNTGLGGVQLAAQYAGDKDKSAQVVELMHYQITSSYCALVERAQELYPNMRDADRTRLFHELLSRAYSWAKARDTLTYSNVPPLPMVA